MILVSIIDLFSRPLAFDHRIGNEDEGKRQHEAWRDFGVLPRDLNHRQESRVVLYTDRTPIISL